jgi:two-component system OmpR family sensor kinase
MRTMTTLTTMTTIDSTAPTQPAAVNATLDAVDEKRGLLATVTAVQREAPPGKRMILADTRVRILAAFVVLTVVSAALALFLVREVLFNRLDEEVEQHLAQEVAEFQKLVRGNDPRTGKRFGTDVRRIFDVYFSRNVPDEGEVVLSSIDRRLYRWAHSGEAEYRPDEVLRAVALQSPLDAAHRGTVETSTGPAAYRNIPVEIGDRVLATFTVANFPANERDEIESAVTVAAQVFAAVLLLSFFLAWGAAGRVLAPLRTLRDTAQSITESDLTQRASGRRSTTCSTGSKPPSPRSDSSSTTPATS